MDSFTVNKIAGAFLGTCLVGMGIGIVAQGIFAPEAPKKPGYALPEPKPEGAGGAAKPAAVPLPVLLSKADPKKGEKDVQVCSACHNLNEGGGTKIGPDLYGVVDRPKGSVAGFDYSAGMKAKGGKWTFEDLNTFLTKPSAYVQGTKMGYPGEESPEKRADILAYLASNAKPPVPLPKVTDADKKAAEGGGKPAAGGEAKAGGDDIVKLIAEADPKAGEKNAQVCGACHNLKEGGGVLVGPPLYGVIDRDKASVAGFDYSAGLKAKGGKWTYADMDAWLKKPAAYVPGTKMGYPGEENDKKRASIIAYLRTLAKTPAPLPKAGDEKKAEAAPAPAAGGAKPAEGGKPTAGGDEFAKLVASADPNKGKSDSQVCGACHNLKKDGGVLVGPPLWNVVDRPIASVSGFDYSAGLKKKGGKWTYDDLNKWLTNPAADVPGTKMGYPGEANEKKRAAIVAYLRTLADTPAPLPGVGGDAAKPQPAAEKASTAAPTPPAPKADAAKAPPPPPAAKPDTKPDATPAPKPDAPPPAAAPTPAPAPPAAKPDAAKAPPPPAATKPDATPAPKPEQKTEAAPPASTAAKPTDSASTGPQPYDAVDPIATSEPVAPASKTFESAPSKVDLGDAGGAADVAPEPYSAPNPDDAGKPN